MNKFARYLGIGAAAIAVGCSPGKTDSLDMRVETVDNHRGMYDRTPATYRVIDEAKRDTIETGIPVMGGVNREPYFITLNFYDQAKLPQFTQQTLADPKSKLTEYMRQELTTDPTAHRFLDYLCANSPYEEKAGSKPLGPDNLKNLDDLKKALGNSTPLKSIAIDPGQFSYSLEPMQSHEGTLGEMIYEADRVRQEEDQRMQKLGSKLNWDNDTDGIKFTFIRNANGNYTMQPYLITVTGKDMKGNLRKF